MKSLISGILAVVGAYLLLWLFSVGALFAQSAPNLSTATLSSHAAHKFHYIVTHPEEADWKDLVAKRNAAADKDAFDDKVFGDFENKSKAFVEDKMNITLTLAKGMNKFDRNVLLIKLAKGNPASLPRAQSRLPITLYGDNATGLSLGKFNRSFELKADESSISRINLTFQDEVESKLEKASDGRSYFSYELKSSTIKLNGKEVIPKLRLVDSPDLTTFQDFWNPKNEFAAIQTLQSGNDISVVLHYRNVPLEVKSASDKIMIVTKSAKHIRANSSDGINAKDINGATFIGVGGVENLKDVVKASNKKDLSAIELFESKKNCKTI